MTTPSVRVTGLGKVFSSSGSDAIVALRDINFEIVNGERVGIVGVNGAGKSTLLQIIAGVAPPTSGTVAIQGRVHAILTLGLGLREEATGRENLFLEGALLGKSREEVDAKLAEMISFAELGDFIDQPVRTYSSGMKSRLSFACLVHIDPEILIIDEALSVGDAFFAAKATRMLHDLCARGRIVLLVSHSLDAIKQMCQRCIWLEAGRVKADGPSAVVADAYGAATRVRQEAEMTRKFGATGRTWSLDGTVSLVALRLVRVSDGVETALIESGEAAVLRVSLAVSRAVSSPTLRVWIESNDGMLLADETMLVDASMMLSGQRVVEIHIGKIDWRPFLYQAHIELAEDDNPIAHAATTFKVHTDTVIFGGNPLLRTPPTATASSLI